MSQNLVTNTSDTTIPSISFIGGGNMASALISGLQKQGFAMTQITVVELDAAKRQQLRDNFNVNTADQLMAACKADLIVLAVKPQQLRDLAIFLGGQLQNQLVVSIAAGVRSADLSRWLGGYNNIVRVMPNTPAQIGMGISALYAMAQVSALQRAQASKLLEAVGKTLWLEDESQMDAVTAISGSGPAYVFYLIEALQNAAVTLGLSEEQAKQLALHTFAGAGQLALQSADDIVALRNQVTSKGGTTEQGILSLTQHDINGVMLAAAQAAAARSRSLADSLGRD